MSSPTEERIISIPPPSVTGWVTYAIQSVGNAFGTLAGFVYYNLLPGHNSDYDRNRISEAIVKLQRNLVFLDGKIETASGIRMPPVCSTGRITSPPPCIRSV
jgi:hypothetical protein